MTVTWKQLAYISDVVYGISWDGVIDEAPSKNVVYDEMETKPNKTTAAWSKSIGSGGDYATWAAMMADMPDLIAHQVTVTIKAGTTLTETCDLKNKHGLTNEARIMIQAEKYFPTSGAIPTVDSATATTLRDATLASAALGNDYFNSCWVFIVHGTGTDNGFVPITDYVDATGDVIVASWPGTQPDNTSRYLIVGALIDGGSARNDGIDIADLTLGIDLRGIGCKDTLRYGLIIGRSGVFTYRYCGVYNTNHSGLYCNSMAFLYIFYCGIVKCNINNYTFNGGIRIEACSFGIIDSFGISDNKQQGIYVTDNSFARLKYNFGDNNGSWGTYAELGGQAKITAPECSGSSGNHSDPGTAGTASADQASAY